MCARYSADERPECRESGWYRGSLLRPFGDGAFYFVKSCGFLKINLFAIAYPQESVNEEALAFTQPTLPGGVGACSRKRLRPQKKEINHE